MLLGELKIKDKYDWQTKVLVTETLKVRKNGIFTSEQTWQIKNIGKSPE